MSAPKVLYEDNGIKITTDWVEVKKYYFPIATSKRVPFKNVVDVYCAEERGDLDFLCHKTWGMATTNVWWALEGKGERVIIETGSYIRKGFSTKDPSRVVSLINQQKKIHSSFMDD
eukprot:TRINITY_DN16695_c0_g1_i1.p1 TRINITY_DN16695_c0_g1~~TRINITY_DN16695_c0_g1_i1.p1  ORF type:complete len:116 (+),score=13.07 TRINITY_DN16695_c0_g1_i1:48-395(+)